MAECDLCINPYPHMCSECNCIVDDESEPEKVGAGTACWATNKRIWIGSGECFPPDHILSTPYS